jgi:Zn-dependent protease
MTMLAVFSKQAFLNLLLGLPPFLLALTVHEFTHGWIANRKGDRTAALQGRLTLNPLSHIDLIGTLLFPLMLTLLGSRVIFGWAKPVPVNPYNFRNPRKDNMLVALGGPLSNFALAMLLAFLLRLLFWFPGPHVIQDSPYLWPLAQMLLAGTEISIYLGLFNLIPIHPLDGSHILEGLLPADKAMAYSRLSPYGFIILLALLYTGVFDRIVTPIFNILRVLLFSLMGI